uniref:6-phosphogluconolactonase n=1 Tax=mine drainage metagenome TaxID=410659 RepID=E6QHQ6_9ZZZZ
MVLTDRKPVRRWLSGDLPSVPQVLFVAFFLAPVLLLTSCAGFFLPVNNTTTAAGSTTYAYVVNVGNSGSGGTLAEYSITSGVVAALAGSPLALPATPTSIVVAPNNAFLYVATSVGVLMYTINTDGTLTQGNNGTVIYTGPSQPESLAVDATTSWLLIANKGSTELDALAITALSGLPISGTPVSAVLDSPTPVQLTMAPANDNVFIALGTGGTDAYAFNAANLAGSPWGNAPFHIGLAPKSVSSNAVGVDSTSTYLFIAESPTNILRKFAITNLASAQSTYSVGQTPSAILSDPNGQYVYVTNETDNTITGFSLSAGTLTTLTDSPFATAKSPVTIAEDSTKSYVVVTGFGNNPDLWVYSYDPTSPGTLDVSTTLSTASSDPSYAIGLALTH